MTRVAVVGSANLDHVVRCARLPRPGETVAASAYATVVGGKGANQVIAAARAGAECAMVGAVGDDDAAARIRATLAGSGVDVALLRTVAGPSGAAFVWVDDAGENSIVVVPGANGALTALTAAERALVAGADALLCQLEIPHAAVAEALAAARGLRVLNAAPAAPAAADFLLNVDLLVVNESEARILAVGAGGDRILDALLTLVPRVALTLGADGVRYADRDGARHDVRAPRVTAVDTTGAGDTFTGVLAAALAEGRAIRDALELASAAASLAVETVGASASIPARAAVEARRAAAYGG